ncbi:MAG: hypothetical protein ISN29_12065, partial [Gammaproteobacteria bacterium AqS3]|nr:hypothetical protein [Gammaproteobacteria bacterium AqS3]
VPHKDVSVTVTDGDHGLEVTKSSLTIIEGRSKSFKVRLAEDPGSAQTVTLTSDNPDVAVDTDLTVLGFQNTLTFDSSKKWDQNQTVRVYAIHDTDADKADIAATITLADTGVVTETVSVTVLDDDIRLISSPSSLTILEGGSKTFTVRPDSDTYPGNERIINLTRSTGSSDVTFDTNPDKPGNQTQLTFTTNNWTTAQEVTVRAATDADKIDDSATIKLKGDGVKTSYVRVTVLDDDIGLTLVPTSLTVDEGGTHQTFEVKLDTQPRYDRTISLTLSSGLSLAGVTVDTNTGKTGNQTTMTFKLGKWDTNRVVTVKAAHDSNKVDETGTITLSGDGIDSGTVTVNVNDDDKIGLTLSKTSLTIEEGGFRTFTVRPAAQLDTTRTVTLSSTNSKVTIDDTDPDTAGNQTALEFTTSNWRTAQTVKISAAVDDSDKTDETATIKLTGGGFVAKSVDVEVIDDDIGLTLSPTSLTVNEGGSATFTVALADRPTNARSVHLSSDNGVTVDVDPDMSGNQAALTFAPNKWSNARTVTVRAGHDLDGSNGSETISLSVKRGGMTLATVSLPVTVNDDDRGLIVSSTDLTVAENGSGTFTVKLAAKPKS